MNSERSEATSERARSIAIASRLRVNTAAVSCVILLAAAATATGAQEVELGPEVVASVNEDGGDLRVEPSVVLVDSVVVTAWNDSRGGREYEIRSGVQIGWAYSVDHGRSFRFGGYLPDAEAEGLASPGAADSWLAHDGEGTIYLQLLHWPDDGDHQIRVYSLSTDRPDRLELRGVAAQGPRLDKPAMTVAQGGRIWIAYSDQNRIFQVSSMDGGRSWSAPRLVSQDSPGVVRSGADVANCGDRTIVGWVEEPRDGDGEKGGVWAAATRPGSGRADGPNQVYPLAESLPVPPGYSLGLGQMGRIPNNAWLDCHTGSEADTLYLTFGAPVNEQDRTGSRAMMMAAPVLADELRWSQAGPVSGGDPGRYQVFPAVEAQAGGVAIAYYDWRHGREGIGTDVYLTLNTSNGVQDIRITGASTRWPDLPGDREHAVTQRNVGDYLSISGDRGRWVVAWTDGRSGRSQIRVRTITLH